jgi:hypothetical protein
VNFIHFLKGIFPLRLLKSDSSSNDRLLGGLGTTLDSMDALLKAVKNETKVSMAVDTIPIRELELGIPIDPSVPIEVRRASIIARMREQSRPITKPDLIIAVRAFGIILDIQNDRSNSVMQLVVLSPEGIPAGIDQLEVFIEELCRAHVGKTWAFNYSEAVSEVSGWLEATQHVAYACPIPREGLYPSYSLYPC